MFTAPLIPVPAIADDAIDGLVDVAVDPDAADVERVGALHTLRGVHEEHRRAVARRLVGILNEPLHWVASEAVVVVDALATDLAVGVDHGVIVAADESGLVDDGVARHCPLLGPTAVPLAIHALADCPSLPWTFRSPAVVVVGIGSGNATPDIATFSGDGGATHTVEIGEQGTGIWRRRGPRLRLRLRQGDGVVQRYPAPFGVGRADDVDADGVVTVNGALVSTSGITVRRVVAGDRVEFGPGVALPHGVEVDPALQHQLCLRRFIPERQSRRGLAVINDAMRFVGEVYVIAGVGHAVALNDEEFGVVVVDSAGVHVRRVTLSDLGDSVLGPVRLRAGAARHQRQGLLVDVIGAHDDDYDDLDDDFDDDDDDDDDRRRRRRRRRR